MKFKKRAGKEEPEVYGNENFGIPKDCSKKQKFSTVKLFFYLTAVVLICVAGYSYYQKTVDRLLPEITFDKTREPLIYKRLSDITLKTSNGQKYNLGTNSNIQYQNDSTFIKAVNNGKSVFFLSQNPNDVKGYDLCLYNIDNDQSSDTVTVIDKNVSDFKVTANGKYVLYTKESSLYFSDIRNTHMVSADVCEYYLSKNNQIIVFFKDDGTTMYTCGISNDSVPVLVDRGITKFISQKDSISTLYYIKDSVLYAKEHGMSRSIVSTDVLDAIMLGDLLYYTKEEIYEKPLTDVFLDEHTEKDASLSFPRKADYVLEKDGEKVFDKDAFDEATLEYEAKLRRDEIRYYFEINPLTYTGYSLYSIQNNQEKLIDTYLVNPKLSYNSNKSILLYEKYDTNIEKADLNDMETTEEATSVSSEILSTPMDIDSFILKKDKASFFAFEEPPKNQIEISLDGKYLYYIKNNDKNVNSLVRYEIGASSLKNMAEIATDVTDFAVDGSNSSAVMVFNNNTLSFYFDEHLTHLSDSSCHEFFFVDGTLFFYDDYDSSTKTGTLKSVRNSKVSHIDFGVRTFDVRNYNTVAYVKHFKPELGTGNLYVKSGKVSKREDICVSVIIN